MTITPETIELLKRLEAAATKGPWKLHEVDDTSIVEDDRTPIAETCPHGGEDADRDYDENWERHEANAALIAAARNHLRELIEGYEELDEECQTHGRTIGAMEAELASFRTQLADAKAEIERLKARLELHAYVLVAQHKGDRS